MLRGAKHSLIKKKNSLTRNNNNDKKEKKTRASLRRTMSTKKDMKRDVANTVTLEEVHLIIKRCADEVRLRGLREVNIFKPQRIGDSVDEVRQLISCLLKDSRTEYEEEIRSQNIHTVVSAMKWALRHCDSILVPYRYYEEFVRYEQEWDYDTSKGSFNKFLCYLPKQNREILSELFELCAQVTEESHINKMSAERIVKILALCILGDQEKTFGFDAAYAEWHKCSDACLHLFLAYLREKAETTELNPRLTVLLDNYVEDRKYGGSGDPKNPKNRSRKPSMVTFGETTEMRKKSSATGTRPISILRVTREVPTMKTETKRQTRSFTTFLPDVMDSMRRKTIIRPSTMMTVDEKKSAEQMWEEFQANGITGMSDEFLKLFFSLEDRAKFITTNSSVSEKQWSQFSQKGFKSIYVDLPKIEISDSSEGGLSSNASSKEQSANREIILSRNDSGVSMRQTLVWDDFSQQGFRNSVDSSTLTLTSIEPPQIEEQTEEERKNVEKEKSMSEVVPKKSRKGSRKMVKFSSLRKPRSRSLESTPREDFANDKEEDWEDWDIVDLPITTHLAIETIDEIFPYVWMETTAAEEEDKWGEWVFIEPRKGLINECEWVMVEEKSQVFAEWETRTYTRRRKMSAFSTFSIPWVRGSAKSRPVSKVTSRMSRVSKYSMASSVLPPLPAVWAMFDRSRKDDNSNPTNYKFKNKPTNQKSFAYQAAQVRASIMQIDNDNAEATLEYEYEEEEYVEDQYEYNDEDYDYENDPTGENAYYGYTSDPGPYYGGYYDEYQEEEYEEEYYDDQDGYYDQEYYEEDYDYYNQDQGYNQDQVDYDYGYSEYDEYAEEIEDVNEQQFIKPGGFVAQRQMRLQGELPAVAPAPPPPVKTFQGLSHESKYNNSKLWPNQSSARLSYQRPKDIKGKNVSLPRSPKVTRVQA